VTDMNLVAAMRGQYRSAEALLWASVFVKVVIYLTMLATAVWSNSIAGVILLVVACVGQASLFLLRFSSRSRLDVAERLRRLAMLRDGMGREVAPIEAAMLAEAVWDTTEDAVTRPYYTSQLPRGPGRLVDITSECAFFSGSVSNAAGRIFWGISLAASSILVVSLILIIELGIGQSKLDIVARTVLLGVTFWMTEDFVDMALRYKSVAAACERVLRECRRLLDQGEPSLEDAYVLLHDYDAALVGAPPLPRRIYRGRSERLADIWQRAHPSESAPEDSAPGVRGAGG
jgi:hypothetical protein